MEFLTSLNQTTQFFLQMLVVLICLFYGAKKGGITLGLLGGIGLIILIFGFGIEVGKPAISVMLVILAVVVASATLQASGGLDVMLQIAERILRKNPRFVSILAPIVTCTLTVLCGTGHVVYTILPIVYDIAIKNGIRPERPMAASSIGAQMGIIASPVSVAVVTLTAFLINADHHLAGFDGYIDLLKITIPSTYCGILAIGIYSWFRGKDLDKDEVFQSKIKDPEFREYVYGQNATLLDAKLPTRYWAAMWIFLGTIAVVALLGYFKELRPSWNSTVDTRIIQVVKGDNILKSIEVKDAKLKSVIEPNIEEQVNKGKSTTTLKYNQISIYDTISTIENGKSVKNSVLSSVIKKDLDGNIVIEYEKDKKIEKFADSELKILNKKTTKKYLGMVDVIQMFMLLAGALMIIFTKPDTSKIAKNEIFRSGMIALVAVFGISWMVETMFGAHIPMLKSSLGNVVTSHPWTYAIMLLLVSKFVNSQAAALVAFVPIALSIGVSPAIILAFAPACYGYYILPTYPSDLAAIQFDRSGTTHIGKFVINHSFIIPGLVGVITSCIVGYILVKLMGYL